MKASNKALDAPIQHPYAVLLVALLVSFFALQEIVDLEHRTLRIGVDSSIESLLPAGGPELETYAAVRDKFVGDDLLIVVWQADDLFTPEGLAALKRLTRRLNKNARRRARRQPGIRYLRTRDRRLDQRR